MFIAPRKYSEKKSLSVIPSFKNNYLRTFLISLAMALFLVFSIYGIYGMLSDWSNPIPIALILLIFAVLFVVGYEFFNSRFVRRTTAVVVGFLVAFCLTILIMALVKFVFMAYEGTVLDLGWEKFIIATAFCLIVSVLILKYLETL